MASAGPRVSINRTASRPTARATCTSPIPTTRPSARPCWRRTRSAPSPGRRGSPGSRAAPARRRSSTFRRASSPTARATCSSPIATIRRFARSRCRRPTSPTSSAPPVSPGPTTASECRRISTARSRSCSMERATCSSPIRTTTRFAKSPSRRRRSRRSPERPATPATPTVSRVPRASPRPRASPATGLRCSCPTRATRRSAPSRWLRTPSRH